jgi:hypothetical protein
MNMRIIKTLVVNLIAVATAVYGQDELEPVRQAELRRNYTACINGYVTCNKSLLSTAQLGEVKQAELRRNYTACLNGYVTCNTALLSQTELEDAKQSELRRNYTACLNGYVTCNKSLLSATQLEDAKQSELRRNYTACLNGYVTCNKSLLSNTQIDDVKKAELRRNYTACLNGYVTCNKSLLNGKPDIQVKESQPSKELSKSTSGGDDIELARQQIAAERRKLEEEKLQREQARVSQKINLQVSHTQPASDGIFYIEINTNADTASLLIDGKEEGGRADGSYKLKRVARAGQSSSFNIVATDIYGNIDKKTISVTREIYASKTEFSTLNPDRVKKQNQRDAVAIIIGIESYKSLPRADFSNNDARAFYDYAIRALGVKQENIKLLVDSDAEEAEIIKAFRTWLPSRVKSTTDVYVFYSGHGLPTADGQGLYLIPPRADRDVIDDTAIPFAKINAAIQAAKPKLVTIFMDACYSGQARSGETLIASARPVAIKAEKTLFPDSFTVFSASQNDQISSSSPDLKHGIFSYYLMRGMEGDADANQDGKITLGEMQAYLAENVGRQAAMMSRKQVPQLIGDVNRVLVGR